MRIDNRPKKGYGLNRLKWTGRSMHTHTLYGHCDSYVKLLSQGKTHSIAVLLWVK